LGGASTPIRESQENVQTKQVSTNASFPQRLCRLPRVGIVILNWNGFEMTRKCIDSILGLTDYPKESLRLVIIDNGSTDGSGAELKNSFAETIDLLELSKNLGFVKGSNMGILHCLDVHKTDYVLLLNNDTEVLQSDWLRKLVKVCEEDEKVAIVGPCLLFPNGNVQWSARARERNTFYLIFQTLSTGLNPRVGRSAMGMGGSPCHFGVANTVSGACMLIRSEFIREHDMLDEALSPFFGEDVEYCFRAWENGWKVVYRGDTTMMHHQAYSFEKDGSLAEKKFYWSMRNGIRISRRYFGLWRTVLIGGPIFLLSTVFDKKKKSDPLKLGNIRVREKLPLRFFLLFKAFVDAMR